MKNKLTLLLLLCISVGSFSVGLAQNCNNIGFENGSTNWTCKSGSYGISPGPCTPEVKLDKTGCLNGGDNSQVDPFNKADNRHTIMSNKTLMDPNTGTNVQVPCVAPANMFPSGVNTKSFRIGNAIAGGYDPSNPNSLFSTASMAESISFTFTVDATNAGLTYMYAVFLNEAKTSKHSSAESPRFIVKITTASGTSINCGLYNVDASEDGGSNDFIIGGSGPNDGQWKYRNWTKVALDLTSYIGSTVTIEFITADCLPKSGSSTSNECNFKPGGHSAYAYIDLYCTPLEIISPSICANRPTVEICGPDGYASYDWDPTGPGIQPPLNQKCVTIKNPKAGDKYTVNMKSVAGSCPTKTTITLKGSDFNISDVATCPGKSIKLTPKPTAGTVGDYDWKWEPQQNLDQYNIAEPTFTPGTSTTYTVTMINKDVSNCDQVKIVNVNVGAGYTVSTSGATICEGDEATITVTGAETYTWEPGGLTGDSVKVKPTTTTTYTVTGKMSNSPCPGDATSTATVIVNKKPIITTTDQTICIGESAKLSATITGGSSTGNWIGGNGVFSPGRNVINASYKPTADEENAGTVVLTLESDAPAAPCVKDSKTLTITIVPPVTSDAGPDQTICAGDKVQLSSKFGGAATGGTWSGGTGTFDDKTSPTAIYTPSTAEETQGGKVTLKFTVTNGSNATCPGGADEMVVIIDKKPTVSAGNDVTICAGESAKLNGLVGGAATTGVWSGGNGTFTPDNKTLTATYTPTPAEVAAKSVILTLTTDPAGKCPVIKANMTIFINPVATIDAGPDQKACVGTAVQLAGVIGGGATSGTWSGGTGNYQPNSGSPTALYTPSPAEAAAKKVVLTFTSNDPTGPCPAVSDQMTILIDQLPVADAGKPAAVCAGTDIKLKGQITGAASSGTWSGGQGVFSKNNQDLTGTYKPTPAEIAAGKVTLILTTDKTGLCPIDVDSVTVPIYPNPVVDFAVDTPKACPPHCVNFKDLSTITSTNVKYWSWHYGKDTSSSQNPSTCFPLSGFYDVSLTATSDKGCSTSLEKQQFIQTYEKPTANFIADPNAVSQYDPTIRFFDRSTSDVVTWKWDLGDGKIVSPSTKNPVHQYHIGIAGVYMVKLFVVNANGCFDEIEHPVEVLPEFTFYIPNAFTPTRTDGVNDTFFGKGVGIVEYHIWVFDRWGNCVFNTKDINTGWDGRANNGEFIAQEDVFVWKVQLKDVFGKKHDYIGTVTLVK